MRIAVVAAEPKTRDSLTALLERQGHRVLAIAALSAATEELKKSRAAMLVVAVPWSPAVPEILRDLRNSAEFRLLPILCIDAKYGVNEGIALLDAGADDVIQRPFHAPVFLARIRTLLRRAVWAGELPEEILTVLIGGPVELRLVSRQATVAGKSCDLTRMEFELLAHLMKHADRAFRRDELLSAVWNYPEGVETRTLDKHVESLRRKLGPAGGLIQTVHGVGYRFSPLAAKA